MIFEKVENDEMNGSKKWAVLDCQLSGCSIFSDYNTHVHAQSHRSSPLFSYLSRKEKMRAVEGEDAIQTRESGIGVSSQQIISFTHPH